MYSNTVSFVRARTLKTDKGRRARTGRVSGRRGLQIIPTVYQGLSGYNANKIGLTDHVTSYGEVTAAGIQVMSDKFRAVSPVSKFPAGQRIFYDLGCGIGTVVVGMAILNPEIQSRGIEIVPDRVRSAQTALGKIRVKQIADRITIRQGDILSADYNYRDAAWMFLSNLCFNAATNADIAKRLEENCSTGCTLICSRELPFSPTSPFKQIERGFTVPMTWSTTSTCILYKKVGVLI